MRLSQNSQFTIAVTLPEYTAMSDKPVIPRKLQNKLHDANIFGRVAHKKSYITEIYRKEGLAFAKEYLNKPLHF